MEMSRAESPDDHIYGPQFDDLESVSHPMPNPDRARAPLAFRSMGVNLLSSAPLSQRRERFSMLWEQSRFTTVSLEGLCSYALGHALLDRCPPMCLSEPWIWTTSLCVTQSIHWEGSAIYLHSTGETRCEWVRFRGRRDLSFSCTAPLSKSSMGLEKTKSTLR